MAFKKILCPIDFSPGSHRAMATAVRLANERDAELVLLHSWFLPPTAFAGEYTYPADLVQQLGDDAQHGLDVAAAEAVKLGARHVSAKLATGVPWQEIVDTVNRDPTFDLIVTGSHGRTGLKRFLLGSVAEMVVRHSSCPVLTVRADSEPRPFTHVLCPVDFSPWSRHAVNLAAELVQPGGAGITLLHVLELPVAWGELHPSDAYRDLDSRSAALLDTWVKELAAKVAVPVTQRTRVGSPGAQALFALEDDRTIDLVVMGSHGRTGIKRLALGSVAEKLVRHALCPVLVVHHRGDRAEPT